MGFHVRSIFGMQPNPRDEQEKSMYVGIEYEEGVIGSLYYSWEVPSLFRGLRISRIYGTRGSITFESNGLFILVKGAKKRLILSGLRDVSGYKAMFQDFFNSLNLGLEPKFTLSDAKKDLMFIEQIYASLKTS